jgi:hypothetical protein
MATETIETLGQKPAVNYSAVMAEIAVETAVEAALREIPGQHATSDDLCLEAWSTDEGMEIRDMLDASGVVIAVHTNRQSLTGERYVPGSDMPQGQLDHESCMAKIAKVAPLIGSRLSAAQLPMRLAG